MEEMNHVRKWVGRKGWGKRGRVLNLTTISKLHCCKRLLPLPGLDFILA